MDDVPSRSFTWFSTGSCSVAHGVMVEKNVGRMFLFLQICGSHHLKPILQWAIPAMLHPRSQQAGLHMKVIETQTLMENIDLRTPPACQFELFHVWKSWVLSDTLKLLHKSLSKYPGLNHLQSMKETSVETQKLKKKSSSKTYFTYRF